MLDRFCLTVLARLVLIWPRVEFNLALSKPRGYKTFLVLSSVEHEILNAHKYKNIKKLGI